MRMFEVKQFPEMSWSLSRHKTLMNCQMQYFFTYYLSHNGWLQKASSVSKHAYRLKKMVSTDILLGNSVHKQIQQVIGHVQSEEKIQSESHLVENIRADLNTAYVDSIQRRAQWFEKPSKYSMLQEIYYDGSLTKEKIHDIQERTRLSVNHFVSSRTFNVISHNQKVKIVDAERFRAMKVDGINIFAVLDLVYQDENGRYVIVDWKTGKERPDDFYQVVLYVWFLHEKLNIDLSDIEAKIEYLQIGKQKSIQVKQIDIDNMLNTFRMSMELMCGYIDDIKQNKPFGFEVFPKTQNPRTCSSCNYRELCSKS